MVFSSLASGTSTLYSVTADGAHCCKAVVTGPLENPTE